MNQLDPLSGKENQDWPDWFKTWILPYLSESLLWPILFVLWAHVVLALAVVVAVAYGGNPFLGLALGALLLSASGRAVWFEWTVIGRPGWIFLFVVLTWLAGAVTGYWGMQYNLI